MRFFSFGLLAKSAGKLRMTGEDTLLVVTSPEVNRAYLNKSNIIPVCAGEPSDIHDVIALP